MEIKRVVIKKYENRRLYDTANSRYVNLDEIAAMVREGIDVQVLDAATGEDLTRSVLTQIVAENAKGTNSSFPLDILRQMIMASGKASQEGMSYLRSMFDMYQNAYRNLTPPSMTPFDFMQRMGQAPTPQQGGEVEELRKRIEQLEKLVDRKVSAKPAKPKAAAKKTTRKK